MNFRKSQNRMQNHRNLKKVKLLSKERSQSSLGAKSCFARKSQICLLICCCFYLFHTVNFIYTYSNTYLLSSETVLTNTENPNNPI